MSFLTMDPPMLSDLPSSSPTGSTSPQETSGHNNNDDNQSGPPGTSSLLFGFLITFLGLSAVSMVVLIFPEIGRELSHTSPGYGQVFMGCGFGSRWMIDRRRRTRRFPDPSDVMAEENPEPIMWDVWTVPGHEKWMDMMVSIHTDQRFQFRLRTLRNEPLSAELRRPPANPPSTSAEPPEQILSVGYSLYQTLGRHGGLSFATPSHWNHSPDSVQLTSGVSKEPTPEQVVNLQLAVLVAMPFMESRARDATITGEDVFPTSRDCTHQTGDLLDVAIGVATIPWDKESADFG